MIASGIIFADNPLPNSTLVINIPFVLIKSGFLVSLYPSLTAI